MKKAATDKMDDDLRPEYDLSELRRAGPRGKYVDRYRAGTNLVLLDPDVARAFPDDNVVNLALRMVMKLLSEPGHSDVYGTPDRKRSGSLIFISSQYEFEVEHLTPEQEAALDRSIAQSERGEGISMSEMLERLRAKTGR